MPLSSETLRQGLTKTWLIQVGDSLIKLGLHVSVLRAPGQMIKAKLEPTLAEEPAQHGHEALLEQTRMNWIQDEGDKTHRIFYDLDEDSLVLDIGGYEGRWASDIFSMYRCTVHVFEPIPEFAAYMRKRFARNTRIVVHEFGLSNKSKKAIASLDRDSSSVFKRAIQNREIELRDVAEFLARENIHRISLMKINIEGGEYDLLERLIQTGLVKNIRNIQVQFHDFVPFAEERMRSIQEQLSATHVLTYQYPFMWDNWRLR